ncbi:MAG TPA: TIGR04290 family methyltransferase [Kofleriaceae bacterium]|jgi:tRNA (mo5U34)-methyltransferase|nr:TIGR04290 family methyltransferase [Kofleriaceae bacterium]
MLAHGSRALERRIRALGPWFHNLVLDGIPTAPDHFLGDYPAQKFHRFAGALPDDLTGKTVLDVGCNAGFYAFEMKRRGAAHVVAIDPDPRYLAQARLAAEVLGHDIELIELDVYHVAELAARFDLVLFMGVLYHLRHPLLALDRLYDHAVRDRLLFQSMLRGSPEIAQVLPDYPFHETAIFDRPGHPALYFVEQRYAGDWTNWWIPNRAAIEAMLRSAGFSIEVRADDEVYLCRRAQQRSAESETTR